MDKLIRDIMVTGPNNAVVEKGTMFRDVLVEMDRKRLGAVCVVENGKLIGIITDGDIRRMLLKTQHSLPELFVMNIEKIMIWNPKAGRDTLTVRDGLEVLEKNRFWVLPVVNDEGVLRGMLHMQDVLKTLAD